jgi:S-DNA-T family DNA segregation ATPase FtsK/SpoIIIE
MAKKDRKSGKDPVWQRYGTDVFMNLSESTRRAIGAVIFIVLAVFLLLAAFEKAGLVGDKTFGVLNGLMGIGYYFFPVVLIALGVLFMLPRDEEKNVAKVQIISAVVLFLSVLALIHLALPDRGGFLGRNISHPLVTLFDTTVTTIILIGIVSASALAMLDTALSFHMIISPIAKLFRKKEGEETPEKPIKIAGMNTSDENYDDAQKISSMNQKKIDDKPKVAASAEEEVGFFGKGKPVAPAGFRLISQKPYTPPPIDLLEQDKGKPGVGDIKANSNIIKRTLQNFGIDVEMDEISIGPSVTRYALKPAEGVKLARIVALQNDLSLALAAHPIRIEAPIPGKSLVGIEIPNTVKTTVGLGNLIGSSEFSQSDKPLLVSLGKGVSGRSHFANIAKMPHILVAGATGSGKSVTIHALITSLLYRNSPEHLKFIMIDPKRVELTLYNSIPHLLTPVITDAKKAILALKWAAKEMDRRYDILEKESVRDIDSYHKNILAPRLEKLQKSGKKTSGDSGEDGTEADDSGPETMPYIVLIIDELADIMQTYPRELESSIVRLAQMSRAVGIHLVLSTQRPSVNVITGLIKANIPTRLALQVTSQIDSRTILDAAGAEKLLGAGDMLFQSSDMAQPQRIQSAFISEREVKSIVDFLKKQYEDELMPTLDISGDQKTSDSDAVFDSFSDSDGEDEDELYEEAKQIVMEAGKASTSFLQRKLRIGYARAARLIDILEERGVVSAGSGAKPRDVLMRNDAPSPQSTGEETMS